MKKTNGIDVRIHTVIDIFGSVLRIPITPPQIQNFRAQ